MRVRSAPVALAFTLVALLGAAPAALAAVSELEDNDTLASANPLTPLAGGLLVEGELEPADVDFFAFPVSDGDFLTLGVIEEGRGAFHDPALRVYDASNAFVAGEYQDDDAGPGFLPALRLRIPAGGGGTWKVAVTGFGDADFDGAGHDEAFAYQLVIGAEPPAFDEPSPDSNDLPQNADSLGSGDFEAIAPGSVAVIDASLEAGDVDHFSFPVSAGRRLSVAIYEEGGGAFHDPVVSLLDAIPPDPIADDDAGPGFLSALLAEPQADATWTVAVAPFGDDADAYDYRLVVALAPAADAALLCDVNDDAFIDRRDVDLVFAARGSAASGSGDPRDANADGLITVQDVRLCTLACGNPQCALPPPPPPACGLLGIEPLVVLLALGWTRRRRPPGRSHFEENLR